MRSIEFEIAVKKLDLLNNKICFAKDNLDIKEDNILVLNFISIKLLELLDEFALNPAIFNEIIKISEKFYNNNKKQYNIDFNEYNKLTQDIKKYKNRFNKISNQLEFLNTNQR